MRVNLMYVVGCFYSDSFGGPAIQLPNKYEAKTPNKIVKCLKLIQKYKELLKTKECSVNPLVHLGIPKTFYPVCFSLVLKK